MERLWRGNSPEQQSTIEGFAAAAAAAKVYGRHRTWPPRPTAPSGGTSPAASSSKGNCCGTNRAGAKEPTADACQINAAVKRKPTFSCQPPMPRAWRRGALAGEAVKTLHITVQHALMLLFLKDFTSFTSWTLTPCFTSSMKKTLCFFSPF